MRTWIAVTALVVAVVVAPAAEAHTLSKRGAARLARAAASRFAHARAQPHERIERVGGGPGYCARGSAHRVVCAVARLRRRLPVRDGQPHAASGRRS
jgi:hypothetical protein